MLQKFKTAVGEKNLEKARNLLVEEVIDGGYPQEEFKDAIEIASFYNVFENHDGEKFIEDPEKWTEEYYNTMIEGLKGNFSKERFMRTYYISRKLKNLNCDDNLKIEGMSYSDNDKDRSKLFKYAKVGGAVAAATAAAAAVGFGALLLGKRKKK